VVFDPPDMDPLPETVLLGRAVPISAALYTSSYIAGLEWPHKITKLHDWYWFCMAALRYGKIVSVPHIAFWWRQHTEERVTDLSVLENEYAHHKILFQIENVLRNQGQLTVPRGRRLAQYFYKELRILSRYDRSAFKNALKHIYELDSRFLPVDEEGNKYIRMLCRVLGVRRTLLLYSFLKRLTSQR